MPHPSDSPAKLPEGNDRKTPECLRALAEHWASIKIEKALLTQAADEIEQLRSQLDACRAALREAMQRNWMDEDMPQSVAARCQEALK